MLASTAGDPGFFLFLVFDFLSVLRGHSFFSIPAKTAKDLRLRMISIPDVIHYIYFLILILEKEPVFPFSMLSAKQGNFWYHFLTSLVSRLKLSRRRYQGFIPRYMLPVVPLLSTHHLIGNTGSFSNSNHTMCFGHNKRLT